MEVERFWFSRSLSWASGLFYLNRYLALFGHIPVMVQYYWDLRHSNTKEICRALSSFHQHFALAIQVIVGILLILRTYALYERNKWVLLCVCTCALAAIVFGAWSVAIGRSSKENSSYPKVGCLPPTNSSEAKRLAAAWTGNLMFDVLIFSMTVYKSSIPGRGDRPLLNTLLRDGAVYFAVMVLAGLANILSFHLSPEYERGFITTFANIISSTMISRLMLNLRDPKLSPAYSEAQPITGLQFNRWESDGSDATTTIGLEPL